MCNPTSSEHEDLFRDPSLKDDKIENPIDYPVKKDDEELDKSLDLSDLNQIIQNSKDILVKKS